MKVINLPNEGFVAAGKTLYFPSIRTTTPVALSPSQESQAREGLIRTMTICGHSLEGVGIYDGDKVIVKKITSKKEIGYNTICIVYIPTTGEVVAKRIRFAEGMIVLRSCNNEVRDMYFHPDDIDIRGVVIGLQRPPDASGRFDRGYDNDIPR